jgi:hypothetical protein
MSNSLRKVKSVTGRKSVGGIFDRKFNPARYTEYTVTIRMIVRRMGGGGTIRPRAAVPAGLY